MEPIQNKQHFVPAISWLAIFILFFYLWFQLKNAPTSHSAANLAGLDIHDVLSILIIEVLGGGGGARPYHAGPGVGGVDAWGQIQENIFIINIISIIYLVSQKSYTKFYVYLRGRRGRCLGTKGGKHCIYYLILWLLTL